jgi:hypothetical protein
MGRALCEWCRRPLPLPRLMVNGRRRLKRAPFVRLARRTAGLTPRVLIFSGLVVVLPR